jgi:hypothetical protein
MINQLFMAFKYWTWQPWRWATWYEDESTLLNWDAAWHLAGIILEARELCKNEIAKRPPN